MKLSLTHPLKAMICLGTSQPRTQACSRYPNDQRRLGTEREFSRQA